MGWKEKHDACPLALVAAFLPTSQCGMLAEEVRAPLAGLAAQHSASLQPDGSCNK